MSPETKRTTVNSYINVRSGPNSNDSIIGKIKPDEPIEIISVQYKIKYGEGDGYINPNDVKVVMHKVCIDAGHGGKEKGVIGTRRTQEKVLVLDISKRVEEKLLKYPIEVVMTRENDTFVSIDERVKKANVEKCDIFVSIHLNYANNKLASGVETYHYPSSVGGEKLAALIQNGIIKITGAKNRGVKISSAAVLKKTAMTSVIVQGGFLSNASEEAKLLNEEYREKIATAVSNGILEYLGIGIPNFPDDDLNNDIEGTLILGNPEATIVQAQQWAKNRGGTQKFISLAPIYWEFGELTGIRPDILYCQSAKETAFGRFGGAVTEDMNNFSGIKTKSARGDRREDHETFKTVRDGVRAHFNHICAYIGIEPIGEPHPRYYIVKSISWAGTIKTVEEFGGKYAPYPNYGLSIINEYLEPMIEIALIGIVKVKSYLNVRNNTNTNSNVMGKLKPNEKVEILALEGGWYKIKYGNEHGYVSSKYISVSK